VSHAACMGGIGNIYKILVRKPEGWRPHGRQRDGWEDNITRDLGEIGCEVVDWIHGGLG